LHELSGAAYQKRRNAADAFYPMIPLEISSMRKNLANPRSRDIGPIALAVTPVVAASLLGQLATYPNLRPWYAGLTKPSFNPTDWVFAPVWTALFVLMAFAVWRILRLPRETPMRDRTLVLFYLQLALNAAWSWMFFAANSPLFGLMNIVPQFVVILFTLAVFRRLDAIAGWCLVPLAAWVGFAIVLNFSIWWLNG
jgi:translocator protein